MIAGARVCVRAHGCVCDGAVCVWNYVVARIILYNISWFCAHFVITLWNGGSPCSFFYLGTRCCRRRTLDLKAFEWDFALRGRILGCGVGFDWLLLSRRSAAAAAALPPLSIRFVANFFLMLVTVCYKQL